MSGSWRPLEFPALTPANHRITSRASKRYNCIAWAAGDNTCAWWPDFYGIGKWPENVPRAETIDAFVQAFKTMGYQRCADGSLEIGFQKVAIYGKIVVGGLSPTHMAVQLQNGNWSSKLEPYEDIEHSALDNLFGTTYGLTIAKYMKRVRPATS
jgi:hypothetical protein